MTFSIFTKCGTREINEDSVFCKQIENKSIFVLADGLGGHGGGEIASKLAVDTAIDVFEHGGDVLLQRIFEEANNEIIKKQDEEGLPDDMKTTMVCLVVSDQIARWGHVGDSRLYFFRDGKPVLRTLDHSVPQALVLAGRLKEKKIRFHEDRSRLLRAMGVREKEFEVEVSKTTEILKQDAFLLCSDGFWEWVNEKEMCKTLKKADSPQEWLNAMEKILLKNGGKNDLDNYSAIAVFI